MFTSPRTVPLFPYTTLFRSAEVFEGPSDIQVSLRSDSTYEDRVGQVLYAKDPTTGQILQPVQIQPLSPEASAWLIGPAIDWPDRKSTRLNSSHRCISYAVFC